MKKLLCFLVLMILVLSETSSAFAQEGQYVFYLNKPFYEFSQGGVPVRKKLKYPLKVIRGTSYISLRSVVEIFDLDLDYSKEIVSISSKKYDGEKFIYQFHVGTHFVGYGPNGTDQGGYYKMKNASKIIDGRLYLPLSELFFMMGEDYRWDPKEKSITVNYKDRMQFEPPDQSFDFVIYFENEHSWPLFFEPKEVYLSKYPSSKGYHDINIAYTRLLMEMQKKGIEVSEERGYIMTTEDDFSADDILQRGGFRQKDFYLFEPNIEAAPLPIYLIHKDTGKMYTLSYDQLSDFHTEKVIIKSRTLGVD